MMPSLPRRPATWSGRAALISRALHASVPAEQALYAWVDCAHRGLLLNRITSSGLAHARLHDIEEGAPPPAVMPYLLELPGQHDVGMLLAEGFGQSWFTYLCSELPLPALIEHLRRSVQLAQCKQDLALWDPRVALAWLSTADAAPVAALFEGIGALFAESPACGRIRRYGLQGQTLAMQDLRLWSEHEAP